MTRRTLFDLGEAVAELYERLTAETETPLSEDEQAAIIDAYLAAEGDLCKKVDAYCGLLSELAARAEARKAESIRLARLADADAAHADRLRARLEAFCRAHGYSKLETPRYRLAIVRHGGKLPLVVVEGIQVEAVDARFRRTRVELDRDAVRSALEAGEALEFARLGERGSSLRIK